MAQLELENMRFYAFHGHYKEEQLVGGKYCVNLIVDTDTTIAEETDNLSDTTDYSTLYQVIKEEMEIPSKLLEHLARRIIKKIREHLKETDKITLKISKLNPPIGGEMDQFSITLNG